MRDPEPAAGAEHGIEAGDQAAGGPDEPGLSVLELVHVGFSIADNDEGVIAKGRERVRAEAFARPRAVRARDRLGGLALFRSGGAEGGCEVDGFVAQARDREAPGRRIGRATETKTPHPFCKLVERALEKSPCKTGREGKENARNEQREREAPDHAAGEPVLEIERIVEHGERAERLSVRGENRLCDDMGCARVVADDF